MSLIEEMGADPDNLRWEDLAFCQGGDASFQALFFDDDPISAKYVKQICEHCPVKKYCREFAEENGESGLWGGAIFVEGKLDPIKNSK